MNMKAHLKDVTHQCAPAHPVQT